MATKLLGADSYTIPEQIVTGNAWLTKFQADYTGTLSSVQLYCEAGTATAKVAVYDDDGEGGLPYTRLAKQDTATAVAYNSWSTVILESPISIIEGLYYWIAVTGNKNWACTTEYFTVSTYSSRYVGNIYSTWTWPDPISTAELAAHYKVNAGGWGTAVTAVFPVGIASAEAIGTPTVTGSQTVYPTGIATAEAIGTPAAYLTTQSVYPTGISSAESIGTPTASNLTIATLYPVGIASSESIGVPLVQMPHAILEAKYRGDVPIVNRIMFTGRRYLEYYVRNELTTHDLLVYAEASNDTDISDSEESSFHASDLSIKTNDDAQSVADAMLDKYPRLTEMAVVTVAPNFGHDLWDVIRTDDEVCNQTSADYRIIGMEFHFDQLTPNLQTRLWQTLRLGGV